MRSLLRFFLLCLLLLTVAGLVFAEPIGPVCPTCQGGIYDLTYSTVSTGTESDVFNLFLNIDTSSYTGNGLFIGGVAPKPSNSLIDFSLVSAPGGVSLWTTSFGGLNANGCSEAGSGFFCSESSPGATLTNDINNWEWQITIPHGSLFSEIGEASIKVLFTDLNGSKVGAVVSEDITLSQTTPVPEPSTLILMGGGLVFLVRFSRKKMPAHEVC